MSVLSSEHKLFKRYYPLIFVVVNFSSPLSLIDANGIGSFVVASSTVPVIEKLQLSNCAAIGAEDKSKVQNSVKTCFINRLNCNPSPPYSKN